MHYHLDAVGGIAGDMFVAALLDLHPERAGTAVDAIRAAGLDDAVGLAHEAHDDGVLTGSRFIVRGPDAGSAGSAERGHEHAAATGAPHSHDHRDPTATPRASHAHAHHHAAHAHVTWAELRARLAGSALAAPVRARAIDIFTHLAVAEGRVHGRAVDEVSFHEVGAWDSIADIVAASALLETLGTASWSVGPLPLGSGRVRTAHGLLPVPAPATALLLEGFACYDDGFAGERVTPTGAAILRHLAPAPGLGAAPRALRRSGHGFGTRRFEGLPNVLRVLEFAPLASVPHGDTVTVIRFEIDDQRGEDLALGLERLRATDGVIDVTQQALTGKHGRLVAAIQVLARPETLAAVSDACFRETTTLGLRVSPTARLVLPREETVGADGTRVKLAHRPHRTTAKAELADLAGATDHAAREARRARAEAAALAAAGEARDDG
ncbi:MAG: LarC family nickel insertion protein [Gammaproteobacteria bacterium]